MWGNLFKCKCVFRRISLHCKLVPVQFWEYEYGPFHVLTTSHTHKHLTSGLNHGNYVKIPGLHLNQWTQLDITYSFLGGFSQSSILSRQSSWYTNSLILLLNPVLQSSARSRFVRCWHAPSQGWSPSNFHNLCDGRGPTVTIIRVGSYTFGGYTDKSWDSSKCFNIVWILQLISTRPRCGVWNFRTRV